MASRARVYIAPEAIRGSLVHLEDPHTVHYLSRVLRLHMNDAIECFDGQGRVYDGMITSMTRKTLEIRLRHPQRKHDTRLQLTLAQALPKGDRFDWVVQKATELGATHLVPLITQHTIVRPSLEQGRKKCARWQRIAREAAKQCRRATIPAIDPPQPLEAFLPSIERSSLALMPTLAVTAIPLDKILRSHKTTSDVLVLIGPEGDFTREEVRQAQAYGARPTSLGPLTLRAETAALATLAILHYALGET